MPEKNSIFQQEEQHLRFCLDIIRQNTDRYQAEQEERHAQVQALYKAINSGDVELYNQLMTASSLEEHAAVSLRKNTAALRKPYFGRIDFLDAATGTKEQVYIGKNGIFKDKTEVLIADWRAPISSVYYENELGEGSYGLPDEAPLPINLHLKRTYDIEEGTLKGFYDSDVASNDELLVQYLSRNKDVVLGEIIATIQREQDEIIRKSPFANLIVQGVAGSGKTTVAMHRISYLLYNYKHRFESNEYCIIGSSDLLLNYITSGLPELDVPNIKHLRMDQLFVRLCGKSWRKSCKAADADESARLRCSLTFIHKLDYFLLQKRESLLPVSALEDPRIGVILTESGNRRLVSENPAASVCTLLSMLDDRAKTRIRFLMDGYDKDVINAKLREYARHYKDRRPRQSIYDFYREFLQSLPAPQPSWEAHLARVSRGEYDLYDIAALALIHYRIFQNAPNQEFGLLFLDEAQDFGISVYYVLRTLLPAAYFTIMGDVSQNINYDTGLNDWYELQKLFLTGEKDQFLLLQKSYRNTIEISEYAGKILEKASLGRYKITPVIRHGLPVEERSFWSDMEMAEYASRCIAGMQEKGYSTTAVICRDEKEAEAVRGLLRDCPGLAPAESATEHFSKGVMVLPVRMVKGLEFDTVILWNPDRKRALSQPEQAKLLYVAATRALHELYVLTLE